MNFVSQENSSDQFEAVLLAAGQSLRMGETNKLLMEFDGTTLVRRTAELHLACDIAVTVVLGHQAEAVRAALDGLDVTTIFNPAYELGQQTSVATGIKNLSLTGSGVLIGLCDQPFLTKDDLNTYMSAFLSSSQDKVFVPYFKGVRGNPALFP